MMLIRLSRTLREAGVLGMNRRNSEYIMRWNPRSAYPIVDNKVLTRNLAEKFGVPTPQIFSVVENYGQIPGIERALGDRKEFVLKPARGAGGSGILLLIDRNEKGFISQSGKRITREDLAYQITDILSGIHSLGGQEDQAILQALVHPDPIFSEVMYQGVPDVRIIVYRGVPLMAMVRLPTRASDGKANLHRGAIGAGIDIVNGLTTTAVHRSEVVTRHPDTGGKVSGIQVPYWGKMLFMAARAWEMTGLGYLGMDIVIDRDHGPLLLELNARPGLAIQIANRRGLRSRLEKIEQASQEALATPESRVIWAMEAFGEA
jgi:alpha-L-glutamate ligase-like protein